jgi:hypothetical protein
MLIYTSNRIVTSFYLSEAVHDQYLPCMNSDYLTPYTKIQFIPSLSHVARMIGNKGKNKD